MPPDPTVDEEEYESSQDSDFAPDDAVAADGASEASDSEADDEDAATKPKTSKRKRDADGNEAEDAGFENSGDEALIKKAKKKKRKKAKDADAVPDEDDEGGEGGLVKTRSMRAAQKEERKAAAASGPVTVDVDAIWAQMLAGQPEAATPPTGEEKTADEVDPLVSKQPGAEADARQRDEAQGGDPSEMIRIKRTYNFAGKVHTEEKLVARSSAEAKLHLASLGKDAPPDAVAADAENEEPKRVLKKAFRSAFEPIIEVVNQRSDLNLGMTVRIKAREKEAQAKKLNTVEKSKMDWAGFVDKEGLKDELELAGRAKGSYAERQDFLARSEAKRDEEARRARLAGRVL
ncbi:SWR1-complex protein 5 [Colletotrichum tofieldiae]|nr:SWR1-complex protein 5 [Colletotrichum tofieldiae]GKT80941.1 SWR1-complex protein 5 [Colletotrichum tofieldiae]